MLQRRGVTTFWLGSCFIAGALVLLLQTDQFQFTSNAFFAGECSASDNTKNQVKTESCSMPVSNGDLDWEYVHFPRVEPILKNSSENPSDQRASSQELAEFVRALDDPLRFAAAHVCLVEQCGLRGRHCQSREGDRLSLSYHGLDVILNWKQTHGRWIKSIEYPNAEKQQRKLIQFWSKELQAPRFTQAWERSEFIRLTSGGKHELTDAKLQFFENGVRRDIKWISIGLGEPYPQVDPIIGQKLADERQVSILWLLPQLQTMDHFVFAHCALTQLIHPADFCSQSSADGFLCNYNGLTVNIHVDPVTRERVVNYPKIEKERHELIAYWHAWLASRTKQ